MKFGSFFHVISKNRSVYVVHNGNISFGCLWRGEIGESVARKGHCELLSLTVTGDKITFHIGEIDNITEDWMEPLLSETLVLALSISKIIILDEGKKVLKLSPRYLDRVVKNIYARNNILFIEI